jgi:hypothetical protein
MLLRRCRRCWVPLVRSAGQSTSFRPAFLPIIPSDPCHTHTHHTGHVPSTIRSQVRLVVDRCPKDHHYSLMIKSYGFACFYQSVSPYATLTHVCNKALVKEGEERKMIKKKKTEDTHTHTHTTNPIPRKYHNSRCSICSRPAPMTGVWASWCSFQNCWLVLRLWIVPGQFGEGR